LEREVTSELINDMESADDAAFAVQVAAAGEAARLTESAGNARIVLVPVTAGHAVELPFAADQLAAKLGANGNLAIKVGGRHLHLPGLHRGERGTRRDIRSQ
jgi:hypothetical protein